MVDTCIRVKLLCLTVRWQLSSNLKISGKYKHEQKTDSYIHPYRDQFNTEEWLNCHDATLK